jgi:hypothetical protein
MDNKVHTFFSYPYSTCATAEKALELIKHIPAHAEIILLQDSGKPTNPALKAAVEKSKGKHLKVRISGPWNNVWKAVQAIEIARDRLGEYRTAGSLWFISLISEVEVHSALKRHRAVNCLTNREEFFLKTLHFGEDQDEVIAMTLNQQMGYVTNTHYKDLTAQQAFDLTSFEGCRFLRPVHDVETCAQVMLGYTPPMPRELSAIA